MKYRVHTFKFAALFLSGVILTAGALEAMAWGHMLLFAALLVLGLLYLGISLFTVGGCVTVNKEGVALRCLGLSMLQYSWQEIQEVGVVGTKVFNAKDRSKTGSLYLYFSPKTMTEEQRFDMCLAWPPKKIIYFKYTRERFTDILQIWNGNVETYNVGDLVL